jgi:hypothetical protein
MLNLFMKNRPSLAVNLDERVFFTLIITGFISLGLTFLSFRYNNDEPCYPVRIISKYGLHYTGEIVEFSAEAKDIKTKTAEWDFGDKPELIKSGTKLNYTYSKPGWKKIKLTIDHKCTADTAIYISALQPTDAIPSPPLISHPQFSGPRIAIVGQPVLFKDSTAGAIKWEWRFGETDSLDASIQSPKYTFKGAGIKIVTLVINGKVSGNIRVSVRLRKVKRRRPFKDSGPGTEPVRVQLQGEGSHR